MPFACHASAFIASTALPTSAKHAFNAPASRTCTRFSVHCVANYRARLLQVRATATGADSTHPSQNIPSEQPISKRTNTRRKVSIPGLLFLIITYIWSIILFVPMLIAHPFVMWRDRATRRFHDFIAMAWMRCSLRTVGVVPKIVNAQNLPPKEVAVVFVANHCSYLDIYSFASLQRRIKYLSKSEIFKIPIVGWAMEMAGNIAVRRQDKRGLMEAYRKMVTIVRNGLSLVVFPEGTRSETGKMRRFQGGAFRAAKQNKAPIVPVTILGTKEIMPSYAWVPLRYPSSPITLIVHPTLDSKRYNVDELRDKSFEAINSALPIEIQTRHSPEHQ